MPVAYRAMIPMDAYLMHTSRHRGASGTSVLPMTWASSARIIRASAAVSCRGPSTQA